MQSTGIKQVLGGFWDQYPSKEIFFFPFIPWFLMLSIWKTILVLVSVMWQISLVEHLLTKYMVIFKVRICRPTANHTMIYPDTSIFKNKYMEFCWNSLMYLLLNFQFFFKFIYRWKIMHVHTTNKMFSSLFRY